MNEKKKQRQVGIHGIQRADDFSLVSRGDLVKVFKYYDKVFNVLVDSHLNRKIPIVIAGSHVLKTLSHFSSSVNTKEFTPKDIDVFFECSNDKDRVLESMRRRHRNVQTRYESENSHVISLRHSNSLNIKTALNKSKKTKDKFPSFRDLNPQDNWSVFDLTKKFRNVDSVVSKFDISPSCIGIYKPMNAGCLDLKLIYNRAFIDSVKNKTITILRDCDPENNLKRVRRIMKYYKRGFYCVSLELLYKCSQMISKWYDENVFTYDLSQLTERESERMFGYPVKTDNGISYSKRGDRFYISVPGKEKDDSTQSKKQKCKNPSKKKLSNLHVIKQLGNRGTSS